MSSGHWRAGVPYRLTPGLQRAHTPVCPCTWSGGMGYGQTYASARDDSHCKNLTDAPGDLFAPVKLHTDPHQSALRQVGGGLWRPQLLRAATEGSPDHSVAITRQMAHTNSQNERSSLSACGIIRSPKACR